MNIILFGGSFDPIHLGHIKMAATASTILNAEVYFIPAKIGVWKDDSVSPDDKMAMLKLALKDYPNFKISTYELENATDHTYTINTVKHFLKMFPNDNLYLLIGGDQAMKFHLWKEADEIAEIVNIIYYPRKGFNPPNDNIKRFNMREIGGGYYEVSSTDVRNLYDLSINPDVLRYIADHELYFMKKIKTFYDESRYHHVISVAKTALSIIESSPYGMNLTYGAVFIAALLHDLGKKIPADEQKAFMEVNYPQFLSLPKVVYHQFVGADMAERLFQIDNEIILDAIRYHTTGRDNMTILEKIIYVSDKIEPLRGFDNTEFIKEMNKSIDDGFVYTLKENLKYFESHGIEWSNVLSNACFKFYKVI